MKLEIKYTKLFIDNAFVLAKSGRTFETINPATEEVICKVAKSVFNSKRVRYRCEMDVIFTNLLLLVFPTPVVLGLQVVAILWLC